MLWFALLACQTSSSNLDSALDGDSGLALDTGTIGDTPHGVADWSILIFMSGDNDLESYVFHDLNELEQGGSTERVQVIVQADRAEGHWSGDGDWTDARRYHIRHDTDDTVVRSSVVAALGEVDMGDPQTLSDFLLWAAERYPAEHTALIMWDHGDGWSLQATASPSPPPPPEISTDDQSGSAISIAEGELAAGLQPFTDLYGPLDVIGFDACNMAGFEVAHALRMHADYMAASEAWVDDEGYQYDQVLLALQATPTLSGAEVADLLAWSAGDFNQELTHSAVDLGTLDALAAAVDTLAGVVLDDETLLPVMLAARDEARGADKVWRDYYLDMADLARVLQTTPSPALAQAGQGLAEALDDSVIANYTTAPYTFTGGLSLFADTRWIWLNGYISGAGATWVEATRWDDLLVILADGDYPPETSSIQPR